MWTDLFGSLLWVRVHGTKRCYNREIFRKLYIIQYRNTICFVVQGSIATKLSGGLEDKVTHDQLQRLEMIFKGADEEGAGGLTIDAFRKAMRMTMEEDVTDEELDMIFMKVRAAILNIECHRVFGPLGATRLTRFIQATRSSSSVYISFELFLHIAQPLSCWPFSCSFPFNLPCDNLPGLLLFSPHGKTI